MRRATSRIAPLAAAAALVLLGVVPVALPGRIVLAADRGLVVVAQTRYEAQPENRQVHVTIDAVATSYTPNPEDGLAYYPSATRPGSAAGSAASRSSAAPAARGTMRLVARRMTPAG